MPKAKYIDIDPVDDPHPGERLKKIRCPACRRINTVVEIIEVCQGYISHYPDWKTGTCESHLLSEPEVGFGVELVCECEHRWRPRSTTSIRGLWLSSGADK